MNIFKCKINFSMLICLMLMFSMVVIAEEQISDSSDIVETTIVEETATEGVSEPFVEEDVSSETTETASEEITEVVDETTSETVEETVDSTIETQEVIDEIAEETTTPEEPIEEINNSQEESNETSEVIEEIIPEENQIDEIEEESTLIKTILNVILDKLTIIKGEILNIKAELSYENESPIPDKSIDFYFDEKIIATETTDEIGIAEIDWDSSLINPGKYLIGIDYEGEEGILESSSGSAEIVIKEEKKEKIKEENKTKEIVSEVMPVIENSTEIIIDNSTTEEIVIETGIKLPNGISKIEECETITWLGEENILDTCTYEINKIICDDEPKNTSCYEELQEIEYQCIMGNKKVEKSKDICRTKGYIINQDRKIDTSRYKCSFEEKEDIVMICDSKYDGNGDGKCTSGESCMKFVIDKANKDDIKRYEKNSRDDFIEEDDSFFLEREDMEVLE